MDPEQHTPSPPQKKKERRLMTEFCDDFGKTVAKWGREREREEGGGVRARVCVCVCGGGRGATVPAPGVKSCWHAGREEWLCQRQMLNLFHRSHANAPSINNLFHQSPHLLSNVPELPAPPLPPPPHVVLHTVGDKTDPTARQRSPSVGDGTDRYTQTLINDHSLLVVGWTVTPKHS